MGGIAATADILHATSMRSPIASRLSLIQPPISGPCNPLLQGGLMPVLALPGAAHPIVVTSVALVHLHPHAVGPWFMPARAISREVGLKVGGVPCPFSSLARTVGHIRALRLYTALLGAASHRINSATPCFGHFFKVSGSHRRQPLQQTTPDVLRRRCRGAPRTLKFQRPDMAGGEPSTSPTPDDPISDV